jgi:phosphoribosyl 1,2-cyclic phosphate phosphodiesterase
MFLPQIGLLFDTPEDVRQQLIREDIETVKHVILTHWHPDHTHGLRVLEQINWNFAESAPFGEKINVYISSQQREWFTKYSFGGFLDFYEKRGMIKVIIIEDKKPIFIDNFKITPYLIEYTKGFYFLLEKDGKKAIYVPCEYHHFIPDKAIKGIDLFIPHNLFWENKAISPRLNAPVDEDSFEEMLKHADEFEAKKIVFTHIEESFQLDHATLNHKMKEYYPGHNIEAAYDGMLIDI